MRSTTWRTPSRPGRDLPQSHPVRDLPQSRGPRRPRARPLILALDRHQILALHRHRPLRSRQKALRATYARLEPDPHAGKDSSAFRQMTRCWVDLEFVASRLAPTAAPAGSGLRMFARRGSSAFL